MTTLFERLEGIESINEKLEELDCSINIPNLQKKIFQAYEKNPIVHDAVVGRQTITQSLEELAKINKGVRRFLPRRKNRAHNERVKQMGELIEGRMDYLMTRGIFYPDNFAAGTIIAGTVLTGGALLFGRDFPNLIVYAEVGGLSLLSGSALARANKIKDGKDQTRYLDDKIKSIYRKV